MFYRRLFRPNHPYLVTTVLYLSVSFFFTLIQSLLPVFLSLFLFFSYRICNIRCMPESKSAVCASEAIPHNNDNVKIQQRSNRVCVLVLYGNIQFCFSQNSKNQKKSSSPLFWNKHRYNFIIMMYMMFESGRKISCNSSHFVQF